MWVKVCVIGIGALGGYIVCSLQMKGFPVQLFVKEANTLNYDKRLYLHTPWCTAEVLFDDVINKIAEINAKLIMICTKSTANETLFAQLKNLKGKVIILLQNGIAEDQKLANIMRRDNLIIGATTNIKASKKDAHIYIHNTINNLSYAALENSQDLSWLQSLLSNVFSDVHRLSSIWALRFRKLWISVACNGVAVLTQQTMSQMANGK